MASFQVSDASSTASSGGATQRTNLNNLNGETPPAGPADGKQRRGTDPTKFKTTMCRNWEAHGTCTFKGCTFAHGSDDLRPVPNKSPSPNAGPASPPTHAAAPPPLPQQHQQQQAHHHGSHHHPGTSSNGNGSAHTTPQSGPQHPPLPRSMQARQQQQHQQGAGHGANERVSEGTTRRVVPPASRSAAAAKAAADAAANASEAPFEVTAPSPTSTPSGSLLGRSATGGGVPVGGNGAANSLSSFRTSPGLVGGSLPTGMSGGGGYYDGGGSGTSPSMGSAAPPPPPPSYAMTTAQRRLSSTNSPLPSALSHMGTEQVIDALVIEVSTVRELCGVHADANMSLEQLVAKERVLRREAQDRMRELKAVAGRLKLQLDRRRAEMQSNGDTLPDLTVEATRQPLNVGAASFVPTTPPAEFTPASTGNMPPLLSFSSGHGRGGNAASSLGSSTAGASPLTGPSATNGAAALNTGITQGSTAGGVDSASTSAALSHKEATTQDASSDVPSSPTDPVQQDRLRQLLMHLDLGMTTA